LVISELRNIFKKSLNKVVQSDYFLYICKSEGPYEIRVQVGSDIFRIFSFFDKNSLIIIGHGFQKKSQKIPHGQLEMAEKIRKEYYEEKQKSH
jgi:phage-related protein